MVEEFVKRTAKGDTKTMCKQSTVKTQKASNFKYDYTHNNKASADCV